MTTLQYNIWTTDNTVITLVTIQHSFNFFSPKRNFLNNENCISYNTDTLLLIIYTENKTQDKRSQNKGGWEHT